MTSKKGVAATGSAEVSHTAAEILRAGGNAFDAALAALCASTVAEPLLSSLGGGGFLLGLPNGQNPRVYDFFCQTPMIKRRADELDFYPIMADFGSAEQEFHIGRGAMAVPGVVAGLFDVHRELGHMPISEVVQPAVELARSGVRVTSFHHYIMRILKPILAATEQASDLFASSSGEGLAREGETLRNPDLARALEMLANEGPGLLYRGEWGEKLAKDCQDGGGLLSRADLENYRVLRREPTVFRHRGARIAINPPPSPGGSLVALALAVLSEDLSVAGFGSSQHAVSMLRAMRAANLARDNAAEHSEGGPETWLEKESVAHWQSRVAADNLFSRGTTHISVADRDGNIASLTVSNGEGCAYVLPETGIMMNNMLGEEDLNPLGFHRWCEGARLVSMMTPTLLQKPDGERIALGSGGSNRIRSAIFQVLVNLLDFGMSPEEAVSAPRIHLEDDLLSIEPGFSEEAGEALTNLAPQVHNWPERNLFFGGVHTVSIARGGQFAGAGDPRRGGVVEFA